MIKIVLSWEVVPESNGTNGKGLEEKICLLLIGTTSLEAMHGPTPSDKGSHNGIEGKAIRITKDISYIHKLLLFP